MTLMKRILALCLCAMLLCSALSGCGGTKTDDTSATGTSDGTLPELDIAGAYSAFEPDTVMMTVAGTDVTWQEMFYMMNYYIGYLEDYTGGVSDWLAQATTDYTYLDYVLSSAFEWRIYLAAIEGVAKENGDYDENAAQVYAEEQWADVMAGYETEEDFLKALSDNYETQDIFEQFARSAYYYEQTFLSLFGESGEKLSDEDLADFTSEDGYMMAKHILIKTSYDDADGNEIEMNDAEKAEAYAKMEDILVQLDACAPEDVDSKFDELMKANSQDDGLAGYPDGYLFQNGDMAAEFYDACSGLDIGAYSGIVETSFGYHIIYRIPVNYDIIPIAYSYYSSTDYTLRSITARSLMSSIMNEYMDTIDYTVSDEYKNTNFIALFS